MPTTESVLYSDDAPALEHLAELLKLEAGAGHPMPIRRALDAAHARFGGRELEAIESLLAWRLYTIVTTLAAGASTRPSRDGAAELERDTAGGGASS